MCFSKPPSAPQQRSTQPEPTATPFVSPEADPNSAAGAVTTRRKLLINATKVPGSATGLQVPIPPPGTSGVRG